MQKKRNKNIWDRNVENHWAASDSVKNSYRVFAQRKKRKGDGWYKNKWIKSLPQIMSLGSYDEWCGPWYHLEFVFWKLIHPRSYTTNWGNMLWPAHRSISKVILVACILSAVQTFPNWMPETPQRNSNTQNHYELSPPLVLPGCIHLFFLPPKQNNHPRKKKDIIVN
jgi:hypothetical protein